MPITIKVKNGEQVLIGDTLLTVVEDKPTKLMLRVENDEVPVTRSREIVWREGVPDHPEHIKAAIALRNTIWDHRFKG